MRILVPRFRSTSFLSSSNAAITSAEPTSIIKGRAPSAALANHIAVSPALSSTSASNKRRKTAIRVLTLGAWTCPFCCTSTLGRRMAQCSADIRWIIAPFIKACGAPVRKVAERPVNVGSIKKACGGEVAAVTPARYAMLFRLALEEKAPDGDWEGHTGHSASGTPMHLRLERYLLGP
jgi:hypothetical protein